jgi:hypothetical protein
VIFNCWPYFREYLQSTVTRMNLLPLTVPLLRLLPKPPRKKPTQTPAAVLPAEETASEQRFHCRGISQNSVFRYSNLLIIVQKRNREAWLG